MSYISNSRDVEKCALRPAPLFFFTLLHVASVIAGVGDEVMDRVHYICAMWPAQVRAVWSNILYLLMWLWWQVAQIEYDSEHALSNILYVLLFICLCKQVFQMSYLLLRQMVIKTHTVYAWTKWKNVVQLRFVSSIALCLSDFPPSLVLEGNQALHVWFLFHFINISV